MQDLNLKAYETARRDLEDFAQLADADEQTIAALIYAAGNWFGQWVIRAIDAEARYDQPRATLTEALIRAEASLQRAIDRMAELEAQPAPLPGTTDAERLAAEASALERSIEAQRRDIAAIDDAMRVGKLVELARCGMRRALTLGLTRYAELLTNDLAELCVKSRGPLVAIVGKLDDYRRLAAAAEVAAGGKIDVPTFHGDGPARVFLAAQPPTAEIPGQQR